MSPQTFDRETWLDLTVNLIPLGILLFFFVGFIVFAPFGFDSTVSSMQFGIVGGTLLLLAIVTYYTGRAIFNAEEDGESAE
jgi:hypothetical protein